MLFDILQNGLYTTKIAPGAETVPVYFLLFILLIPYLLGSLNSAVMVSRLLYHEDIRAKGSGNAGLTNVFRVYGKRAALFTLLGDILKTVLSIGLTVLFFGIHYRAGLSYSPLCYIAGFACVIGHIKPAYYRFRGGKGVLTSATAILLLAPPVFLVAFAVFAIVVFFTKYISLGSIISAAALPLLFQGYMQAFIYSGDEQHFFEGGIVLFVLLYSITVILCHRANIGRLLRHEENKFSFHREKSGDSHK